MILSSPFQWNPAGSTRFWCQVLVSTRGPPGLQELATKELTFEDFKKQSMTYTLEEAPGLQVCQQSMTTLVLKIQPFVASLRKIHVCNGTNKKDLFWTGVTTCSCSMFQFNLFIGPAMNKTFFRTRLRAFICDVSVKTHWSNIKFWKCNNPL